MARSEESLQRRALKRNRTVEEQQGIDAKKAKHVKNQKLVAKAPGAWQCPACETQNFASRYICHAKNCQQAKPESSKEKPATKVETPKPKTKRPNASPDPSASKRQKLEEAVDKVIEWSRPQATASQIEFNQKLRERYTNKDPSLTDSELERARILVARDERKKQKKNQSNSSSNNDKNNQSNTNTNSDDKNKESSAPAEPLTSKDQNKRNKSLLKRFKKSGGEGMAEDEVTRAKLLLARKERKKQQHASPQSGKEKKDKEDAPPTDNKSEEPTHKQQDSKGTPTPTDEEAASQAEAEETSDEAKKALRKDKKAKKKEKKAKGNSKDGRIDDGSSIAANGEEAPEIAEHVDKESPSGIVSEEETPKSKTAKKAKKSKKEAKKENKD